MGWFGGEVRRVGKGGKGVEAVVGEERRVEAEKGLEADAGEHRVLEGGAIAGKHGMQIGVHQ